MGLIFYEPSVIVSDHCVLWSKSDDATEMDSLDRDYLA